MPRKRVNVKVDPIDYLYYQQLTLRVETLRSLMNKQKDGYISLSLLKRVNEEAKDFQRFLEFHNVKKDWIEFI